MNHKDVIRRSNINDLLDDGVENHSDIRQRVSMAGSVTASSSSTGHTIARSTTDPLEINFAEATMADKIDRANPRLRRWAWILLAWPPLIVWLITVYLVITKPVPPELARAIDYETGRPYEPDKTLDWILCGVALIPALFWPYLLLRKRK